MHVGDLSKKRISGGSAGLTLIEIMIVVAILGILGAVAVPSYNGYQEKRRISEARGDIATIALAIEQYLTINRELPESLADVGMNTLLDPWGKPYAYLNLDIPGNRNHCRTDRNFQPLNDDFDLFSRGKDKVHNRVITVDPSLDDVIRVHNGQEVLLGAEY